MNKNEIWFLKQIENKRISVTREGVVRNNDTQRNIGAVGSGGYPKISLTAGKDDSGKWIIKHIQIHRLTWLYFNGDIPDKIQINHKDLNKCNPNLDNLELVSQKENSIHAFKNGAIKTVFVRGNNFQALRKTTGNKYGRCFKRKAPVAQLVDAIRS